MQNIFFDTSILSEIAWYKANDGCIDDKRMSWDKLMDDVEEQFPRLFEKPFFHVKSAMLFLEIIGLGRVKEQSSDGERKRFCFMNKAFKTLVDKDDWKKFYPDAEAFIDSIMRRIDDYVKTTLTPRNLYRQALNFERNFTSHENAHFIMAGVKKWRKNIQNEETYNEICLNFMWDTVSKYPFIPFAELTPGDKKRAQLFWGAIMGSLARIYCDVYMNNPFICNSLLGWCSEIDKVGNYLVSGTSDNGHEKMLKPWSDMVDAESIHFALIGKRKTLQKNEPIIVITCDKEIDIRLRLEALYKNLDDIANKGFSINICPGTILYFTLPKNKGERMQFGGKIDVKDFIDTLK